MEGRDPKHVEDELIRAIRDGKLTRSQLLKRAAVAGVGLSAASILAACADSGDSNTSTGTPAASTDAPAKPGGSMTIALPAGVAGSLDPHPSASLHARLRNWNVFDNLFIFDNAGQLVPALAEEATPNADATEWTIKIKSGVEFHDGSPLTADDVIYSLQRVLNPKTAAEGAGQIGMIDGGKLKKVDATTIRVPLKYAFSILPAQLTYYIGIVKAGEKKFDPPIGTGAFKFVRGKDSDYTLARNPNYWQKDLPHLDQVKVIAIQDATARLNALKTGEVDAIYPTDFTQSASVSSDPKITKFVNKTQAFMPMYMNAAKKPFSDNRVRQALKLAADREAMNKLAYGGEGEIGNDMLSPADAGYPKDVPQREFDPEKAKSLWNEAGMSGQKIQFWTSAVWPGQVTQATVYAQQAKQAGIDVEVKKMPDDQFISKVYGVQPFANDYWYFDAILSIMSKAFVPDASYFKTASWATPETTKLYNDAVAQTDEGKRDELTSDIMRIFHDDGPYIVWGFEASPDLYSARIGGQENSVVRSINGFRLEKFFVKS